MKTINLPKTPKTDLHANWTSTGWLAFSRAAVKILIKRPGRHEENPQNKESFVDVGGGEATSASESHQENLRGGSQNEDNHSPESAEEHDLGGL